MDGPISPSTRLGGRNSGSLSPVHAGGSRDRYVKVLRRLELFPSVKESPVVDIDNEKTELGEGLLVTISDVLIADGLGAGPHVNGVNNRVFLVLRHFAGRVPFFEFWKDKKRLCPPDYLEMISPIEPTGEKKPASTL